MFLLSFQSLKLKHPRNSHLFFFIKNRKSMNNCIFKIKSINLKKKKEELSIILNI